MCLRACPGSTALLRARRLIDCPAVPREAPVWDSLVGRLFQVPGPLRPSEGLSTTQLSSRGFVVARRQHPQHELPFGVRSLMQLEGRC